MGPLAWAQLRHIRGKVGRAPPMADMAAGGDGRRARGFWFMVTVGRLGVAGSKRCWLSEVCFCSPRSDPPPVGGNVACCPQSVRPQQMEKNRLRSGLRRNREETPGAVCRPGLHLEEEVRPLCAGTGRFPLLLGRMRKTPGK